MVAISLPLLPVQLWSRVIVFVTVPSVDQISQLSLLDKNTPDDITANQFELKKDSQNLLAKNPDFNIKQPNKHWYALKQTNKAKLSQ